MTSQAAPEKSAISISKLNPWLLIILGVAFFVLVPIGVIYSALFRDSGDVWPHLIENVLPSILMNTLWLAVGVGMGTFLLGVSLAWLVVNYDFPGRRYFQWFLLLPLAVPTYVLGFVWIGLLDFSSPFATMMREHHLSVPPIRSTGGIIFTMSFALYPYVYLMTRNAFQSMGHSVMQAAATLRMGSWERLTKIGIPLARPWIVGGVMLVVMETLADFGTVAVFNYDTFTTAIYKTWFGLFSLTGASQLSSLLVTFVLVLLLCEMKVRGKRGYALQTQGAVSVVPKKVLGPKAWLAGLFCLSVLTIGFIIPVYQLVLWSIEAFQLDYEPIYFSLFWHTLLLGILAAALVCFFSVIIAYCAKHLDQSMKWVTKIVTMGYALPGTILAVGIFSSMIWLDHKLSIFLKNVLGLEMGKLLTGTIAAMLLAYFVRYLAVGYAPIDSAMQRMTKSIEDAARIFGFKGWQLIQKIHLPIIWRGLITAFVLVIVDVMKEMPITLMTRPFGWDTFAVRIYEMTSEGEWVRAAFPAVLLVLTGLIPLFFLTLRKEAQPVG